MMNSKTSERDRQHLKLLSIFHFVLAAMSLLGMLFLLLHYGFMQFVLSQPELMEQTDGPDLAELVGLFRGFYVFMGGFALIGLIGNLLSGLFLHRRTHRMFSLVMAAFNCIQIPLGTVLGVFTIVVLVRDSVRECYGENR